MSIRTLIVALLVALATAVHARTLAVPDAFTPVLATFVGDRTAPVRTTDGRWHVVYELWLTNARPIPATVTRIDVLDYDAQGRVLATLAGEALASALYDVTRKRAGDGALAPSTSKLAFVELAFDDPAHVPDAIVHRLEGSGGVSPGAAGPEPFRYLVAPWDLAETRPVVLGPPLAGDGWVVANGCCSARGAHRGAVMPISGRLRDAQRFAIDWMRIDAEGRLLHGDPASATSYLAYDQPVLAVADATVSEVLDGLEDQRPGTLPDPTTMTIANVDGNHVILELGGGLYAFYAHLKTGSVRVRQGERVRRGQELGRVGNTGNTSAPHLHLHVMTAPSALAADGLPYVFDRFTLAGALDAARWYAPESTLEERYAAVPGNGRGERRDELPMDLDVLAFPVER